MIQFIKVRNKYRFIVLLLNLKIKSYVGVFYYYLPIRIQKFG